MCYNNSPQTTEAPTSAVCMAGPVCRLKHRCLFFTNTAGGSCDELLVTQTVGEVVTNRRWHGHSQLHSKKGLLQSKLQSRQQQARTAESEAALHTAGQTSRKWWQTHFQSSPLPNFAELFGFYSQSCRVLRKAGIWTVFLIRLSLSRAATDNSTVVPHGDSPSWCSGCHVAPICEALFNCHFCKSRNCRLNAVVITAADVASKIASSSSCSRRPVRDG